MRYSEEKSMRENNRIILIHLKGGDPQEKRSKEMAQSTAHDGQKSIKLMMKRFVKPFLK